MSKLLIQIDEDLADIVPDFLSARNQEMPGLWQALNNTDFDYILTIGHRLKGNAGGYGFEQMGLIGAKIEDAAKAKQATQVEILLSELQNYLQSIEVVYIKAS